MKIKQGMCKGSCGLVKAIKDENNITTGAHFIHFILTICTGFLWLLIWVLHANFRGAVWRCSQCGSIAK